MTSLGNAILCISPFVEGAGGLAFAAEGVNPKPDVSTWPIGVPMQNSFADCMAGSLNAEEPSGAAEEPQRADTEPNAEAMLLAVAVPALQQFPVLQRDGRGPSTGLEGAEKAVTDSGSLSGWPELPAGQAAVIETLRLESANVEDTAPGEAPEKESELKHAEPRMELQEEPEPQIESASERMQPPTATVQAADPTAGRPSTSRLREPSERAPLRQTQSLDNSVTLNKARPGSRTLPAAQLAFELRLRPTVGTPSSDDAHPPTPVAEPGEPPQTPLHSVNRVSTEQLQSPAHSRPIENPVPEGREEASAAAPEVESQAPGNTRDTALSSSPAANRRGHEFAREHAAAPAIVAPAASAVGRHLDNASEAAPKAPAARMQMVDDPFPAAQPAAVVHLRLEVEGPAGRPVDVRLLERDGRLHLAVHTQDAAYNESLRERVGELLLDLENQGFHADAATEGVREIAEVQNARARDEQADARRFEDQADQRGNDSSGSHQQRRRPPRPDEGLGKASASTPSFAGELAGVNELSTTKD